MRAMVLRIVVAVVVAGAACAGGAMARAADDAASDGLSGLTSGVEAPASQSSDAPVCEASAGTRRALEEWNHRDTYSTSGRLEYRKAIDALLAKNPDDVFLHLDYIRTENQASKAEAAAALERYKTLMEKHPGNSEYEFLYAAALIDNNTPKAIERLRRIPAEAAIEPQVQLRLTKIYEFGKFANHEEGRRQLAAYLKTCPGSMNLAARDYTESLATPEMAASYAAQLRSRLQKESDPTLLSGWSTVWNLEFVATPAQQDQIRARMTQDLQQLRKKPVKDLNYLTMLETGYRMAGDKKSQREIGDRIVAEYPDSNEADFTTSRRFEDEHPYPKDEDSVETKQAYYRLSLADADARFKKNPQDTRAIRDRFEAMEKLDEVSNEEIENAGEALRAVLKGELNWYTTPPMDFSIARTYLDRKIRVAEVADLVAEGRAEYTRRQDRPISDRETDELRKALATNDTWVLINEAELLVGAARALQKPQIAKAAMDKLAEEKIDVKYFQIELWEIKGKWAELNGRKLDAVLMYRASLDSRVVGYKPRGKKDDVKEAYERLWKELGGTDSGNDAWLAATAGAKIAADGGWERVSKDLPDAKLVDLNGKTWTLSELKGKTVLINVWASWCGPCRGEHPYLQALYDKVKDRTDIAVVSMSIDESIGDVEPYMKEKKYSFPVLLASRYVGDVAPAFGVPQNWIVGADGKWEWKQEGFGDGEGWEKSVMEKLEGKEGVGKK